MSGVYREFGAKIQVMEIKIHGGKKNTEVRVDYYERLLTVAKRKFKVAR